MTNYLLNMATKYTEEIGFWEKLTHKPVISEHRRLRQKNRCRVKAGLR